MPQRFPFAKAWKAGGGGAAGRLADETHYPRRDGLLVSLRIPPVQSLRPSRASRQTLFEHVMPRQDQMGYRLLQLEGLVKSQSEHWHAGAQQLRIMSARVLAVHYGLRNPTRRELVKLVMDAMAFMRK